MRSCSSPRTSASTRTRRWSRRSGPPTSPASRGAGRDAYEEALAAAFPVPGRDDLTDPETLLYDYDRSDGDGPVEWWEDQHFLLLRFLRQTGERGLPGLALELERLRERATVQKALAYTNQERRYTAPRRAAREAKERPGG